MTFSGDLSGISLADVFQNVAGNLATGWMSIEWRQRTCHVRFSDGVVTGFSFGEDEYVVSPDFLTQRGYVEHEAMSRLQQKHRRSRKSTCQLALAAKLMTAENVSHAVITRVEERVLDLMLLKEAKFHFRKGTPPDDLFDVDQRIGVVSLQVGPLLMEGARRRDEWQQIHNVIGTDRDLLILLEGWDEHDLDPLPEQIAPLLDGCTDARRVVQQVPASRFDVMRAMAELVRLGLARLASAEEIATFAADAKETGDLQGAVTLMQRALELERGNQDLRRRLVEWFEEAGRNKEAAAELAKIAHEGIRSGNIAEALDGYSRAFELDPEDLPLLERRLDLLREHGDDAAYAGGAHGLVAVYLEIGLADRARIVLRDAIAARKSLRADLPLLESLARVESSLGHWEEASRLFRQLAEQTIGKHQDAGLEYLRSALEQTPDDDALATRIRDIESGAAAKRKTGRRRAVSLAATLAVVGTVGVAGVAEFRATRQVLEAFDGSLSILGGGNVVESLVKLDEVRNEVIWSPTRDHAGVLFDRLADLQLQAIERWVGNGDYERAGRVLADLSTRIERADLHVACTHLLGRIGAEEEAYAVLERVEEDPELAQSSDLDVLSELTDPRFLDFLLAHLPRVESVAARIAMLRALAKIDSPRAVPVIARMFLIETDATARTEMQVVLARVRELRVAGRNRVDGTDWAAFRVEIKRAMQSDRTRDSARQLLEMIFPEALTR